MKSDICVLYLGDDITLLHSLYPILRSKRYRSRFYFTEDLDYILNKSTQPTLLLIRYFKRRDIAQNTEIWKRLRDRFKRIIYFDDTASADEVNPIAFDYVDLYYKKQLRSNIEDYAVPVYGKRIYADYYHHQYKVSDSVESIRPALDDGQRRKLRLSWNLGVGCFPKMRLRNAIIRRWHPIFGLHGIRQMYNDPRRYRPTKKTINAVSARLGMNFDRESVAQHRKIYQSVYSGSPLFLQGRISLKAYNRELRHVRAVFSPFGWGEICFRDFEAILNRSILIKPNMDHVTTWPNVYIANKTYIPVDWEGHDLYATAERVINRPHDYVQISSYAAEAYLDAFDHLDSRLGEILKEIEGVR
ncbi:hypothetical protein [Sediminispirochaeta smaragdinae]|uniref:Glycosyltransferase family 1 protein n=1 Tax=Sediminispirochaeta smaragdinae (strain DSM 11293 / JCM 15392 / SEBR 4228) TaxID=573413 RepID=E1RA08_SEDSS|nr:hypothetical protein [Sediminispirochaeta smaragdinae]ADK83327.1 hypothetical protein Spirs_4253 [Sediminispirochaeta smaragdinae DSM 11293]